MNDAMDGTHAVLKFAGAPRSGRRHPGAAALAFRGPERRRLSPLATRWMAMMLDEIDYGMLLLDGEGQVVHVNQAARQEMNAEHPLQQLGQELRARWPQDVARLHDALANARRGLRKLLTLGEKGEPLSLAVIPIGLAGEDGAQATLLMMGKRQVCERLSVLWFARAHGLTVAETRVLEALCAGLEPRQAAEQHGVGLATVRTQIGSIRAKTGAESIRDLVLQVAMLPPMLGRLRAAA